MPASFGWSNNFAVGSTNIASYKAGRFSAAADGSQALLLSTNKYLSQDTGPTAGDTLYTLGFSLLQDKVLLITNSILQAQILDGTNVLATGNFTVPTTSNLWQAFTLTATSSQPPQGDLVIQFTWVSGMPWLDKVWLTGKSLRQNVTLTNSSFEIPAIPSGGWWTNASIPASFGWSNNLGSYVLANSAAGHFSAAADGAQALVLNPAAYISQDTGPTAADTCYSLVFSLLQDAYTPNTNSILEAQIFDGPNLLVAGNFTVPVSSNVWQMFTLTARSPHMPAGHLTIKFTGVVGTPWLDEVLLTSRSLRVPVGLANSSFESPAIASGGWWTNLPPLPSAFGWSNNLGTNVLASRNAGHFSVADDGAQALVLNPSQSIWQDTGPTAVDVFYSLTFNLLQDAAAPNAAATLQAQIFDSTNLLASSSFTVPATPNSWQTFTLTANSPHAPVGDMIIKFTGIYGAPWLDNISLTAISVGSAVSLTNGSFEIPDIDISGGLYGWWTNPPPLPSTFGWSNNLGTYVLANSSAEHFSSAASGAQALRLVSGYISQDTGPTAANSSYSLSFSLLQDNYTPNPNSTVQAQVYDGPNVLAANTYAVPATPNVWQSFTLAATAPPVPAGDLSIKFTGLTGTPWIDAVTLTTSGASGTAPVINTQPQNQTGQLSSNVTFSASVSGSTPLSYQWYSGTNALTGATNAAMTLTNVGFAQAGNYSLAVSNAYGVAAAGPASLTVTDTVPPTITACATNRTLAVGANCLALLPDLTSQVVASDASGAVTVTQSPPAGTALGLGATNITFTVRDSSGNASVCVAAVTVADQTPPVVTLLGANPLTNECHAAFVDPGATANDACAGSVGVTANSTVNANSVGAYTIKYVATDPSGNSATNTRTVYVVDTTPPMILSCISNLTLPATTNCQWVLPDLTATNYIVAEDNCSSVIVTQMPPAGAALSPGSNQVSLTAVDSAGNATNRVVAVVAGVPSITSQPADVRVPAGGNPMFSVTACGAPQLCYQWQFAGTNLAGATNSTLALTGVSANDAGSYRVVVTNFAGSATSLWATLSVALPLVIAGQIDFSLNVFNLTFATEAGSNYAVEYKDALDDPSWQVLTNIPGTGYAITISDPGPTNRARFYRVMIP
jgi:hypothetical protein